LDDADEFAGEFADRCASDDWQLPLQFLRSTRETYAMLLFGERGGPEQKQSQNAVTTPKFPLSRRRVVAVGYWSGVAEL
jgi:hypothetical protein